MKQQVFIGVFFLLSASIFGQTLTDSLKAYYPFNGNSLDATGNGNNGVNYGATPIADRFGNLNEAYHFDGITNYIEFTATTSIHPTTFPISITAWIKVMPGSNNNVYFCSNYTPGVYGGVWMAAPTGLIQINYGDGLGYCTGAYRRTKTGTTQINDGQWHYVVGVIRGAMDMDIYIDCQNDGGTYSGTGGSMVYLPSNTGRMGMFDCLNGNNYHFVGDIDDLRFYNRELTAFDVATLYNYPNAINLATGILGNDTTICAGALNLNASASWATTYAWSNGSTSPTINVNSSGTYWVSLMGNNCGQTGSDTIVINIGNAQIDLFPDTIVCKNQSVLLDAGTGYTNYSWSTGANTQTISVTIPGSYIVEATAANGCVLIDTIQVTYYPDVPAAQFSYTLLPAGMVQFNNTSQYCSQYQWTYSNGGTDSVFSPQHAFPCNTPVTVTLIASGRCGADTTTQTITYMCDGIEDITQAIDLQVFPNPANDLLNINYSLKNQQITKLLLYNALGQIVYEQKLAAKVGQVHTEVFVNKWNEGVYFLQIVTEKGIATQKFWINR